MSLQQVGQDLDPVVQVFRVMFAVGIIAALGHAVWRRLP